MSAWILKTDKRLNAEVKAKAEQLLKILFN